MSPSSIFFLITGIFLFIGFQHLVIGLVSKENKLNLYFGFFALCMAGHEYFNYARVYGTNLHDYLISAKCQAMFFQLGNFFNLIFISEYAHVRLKKMEYVIFSIIGFLLILNFYLPYSFVDAEFLSFKTALNQYNEHVAKVDCTISRWMILWTLQIILSNIYVFIVLGRRYKKNPDKTTLWLIIVCVLVFISIINDDLVIAQIIKTIKLQHFANLFLILVMTALFLREYVETVGLEEKLLLQKQMRKSKEELTHMIVHDLKAPLNILLNLPAEQSKENLVERIKNISQKMQFLVQDIMDVYRNEETGLKMNIENCNLTDLIKSAYENILFFMQMKDVELLFESQHDYTVRADKNHIERVLINLLSNAVKYTKQNGKISVIVTKKENKTVEIKVQDNGTGIAKDKIVKVFQKFQPINKPDNSMILSTGLGLSYCKLAVEAHGSSIILESAEGMGTSVSFYLKFTNSAPRNVTTVCFHKCETADIMQLEQDEKSYLLAKYPDLLAYTINEISSLRKIVRAMEQDDSVNRVWLDDLKKSVLSFDETLFKKTIEAVTLK